MASSKILRTRMFIVDTTNAGCYYIESLMGISSLETIVYLRIYPILLILGYIGNSLGILTLLLNAYKANKRENLIRTHSRNNLSFVEKFRRIFFNLFFCSSSRTYNPSLMDPYNTPSRLSDMAGAELLYASYFGFNLLTIIIFTTYPLFNYHLKSIHTSLHRQIWLGFRWNNYISNYYYILMQVSKSTGFLISVWMCVYCYSLACHREYLKFFWPKKIKYAIIAILLYLVILFAPVIFWHKILVGRICDEYEIDNDRITGKNEQKLPSYIFYFKIYKLYSSAMWITYQLARELFVTFIPFLIMGYAYINVIIKIKKSNSIRHTPINFINNYQEQTNSSMFIVGEASKKLNDYKINNSHKLSGKEPELNKSRYTEERENTSKNCKIKPIFTNPDSLPTEKRVTNSTNFPSTSRSGINNRIDSRLLYRLDNRPTILLSRSLRINLLTMSLLVFQSAAFVLPSLLITLIRDYSLRFEVSTLHKINIIYDLINVINVITLFYLEVLCNPDYRKIPSYATAFSYMTTNVIRDLSEVSYVCTTADCWSGHRRAFIGLTIHWLDPLTLKRRTAALALRGIIGRQTYDVLANEIIGIHKVFGENEEDSSEDMELINLDDILSVDDPIIPTISLPKHQRCCCHNLNLIATTDAEMADINKQNMSSKMADILLEKLGRYLIAPNKTRWNSYYQSMKLIDKMLSEKFSEVKQVCDQIGFAMFRQEECFFVKEYATVMEPLAISLKILEREDNSRDI
ncbi:uncharacterized protein LOC135926697 [Gordionus sp. m RMFG-2023]|uniref:uncharacterized protein LOC135926697 n=1 Tax=Gordionus sp. m RMFG-2023 TaxID=3053472 RepID=UPI0031FBA485